MNNDESSEQTPAEDLIQLLRDNNADEINSPSPTHLANDRVEDNVDDTKNGCIQDSTLEIKENVVVGSQEVNNLLESFENQTLRESEGCMEVDVLHLSQSSLIVENRENNNPTPDLVESNEVQEEYQLLKCSWHIPKLICSANKEFSPSDSCENFTKGCFWSPDGTCVLVPSEDYKIRLFELPREYYTGKLPENDQVSVLESTLKIKEGGTVYDSCWFPYMNSWNPSTCCFLSTSQGSPIHLWDAFDGHIRATYRAYNQVDEVEAAISVQFTDAGNQIWSGFKNALRTFDTDRPGRQTSTIYLKKDFPNVTGLVSCIRENPSMSGLVAFGTYSKCIGLYKDGPLCSFETGSGVTQIEFSPCGTKLYSTVRRGNEFLCWDLRNPGTVLYSLQNRQSDTNQRIHFSLSYSGEELVSGGTDGAVRVWSIPNDLQIDEDIYPTYKIQISKDCVNGVSLHKNLPILAASTGCRICDEDDFKCRDNSLRLYWLGDR